MNPAARSASDDQRRAAFRGIECGDERICPSAHRGLLLDKFVVDSDKRENREKNARQRLLNQVCDRQWRVDSDAGRFYAAAYERWRSLWRQRPAGVVVEAKTAAPLAIGHGAKGVLEGGTRLHRTYGLPMIPASGVRGVVSAFADATLGQGDPRWSAGRRDNGCPLTGQGDYHRVLFGDTDAAGRLAFEDAWWIPRDQSSPLRQDVITPHHQHYYTGIPRQEPAETDDPVPVMIPVVPPGAAFLFVVHWRARPGDDDPRVGQRVAGWLELARNLLEGAIADLGVGAKGSQGYGRLEVDREAEKREAEQIERRRQEARAEHDREAERQRLAALDPVERRLEELAGGQTEPGAKARLWVDALTEWPEKERGAAARAIRARLQTMPGQWDEGSGKKPGTRTRRVIEVLSQCKEGA